MPKQAWHNRIVGHADVDPSALLANPANWRVHPKHQQDALKGVIDEVGFVSPVLVQAGTDTVIDGHMRVTLALRNDEPTIPVTYLDLNDAEAALILATFDPISALAATDAAQLDALLREVSTSDAAVMQMLSDLAEQEGVIGFGEPEAGLTDPDEVPEPPSDPITKPGDLWILGRHRLLCGDSTKREDVDRLMDGEKADMVFTDPPYGMNLQADWSAAKSSRDFAAEKQAFGGRRYENVIGDDDDFDPTLLLGYFGDCREVFLWGADYYAERINGKNQGSWFVWDKRIDESTDKMYGSGFELCWSKERHKRDLVRIKWAGIFGTEQEFDHKRHHPTQKPIALALWFIEKYSEPGDVVADLYAGAGMTALACEQSNRSACLIELSPAYCDVIVQRWENFTGQQAHREAVS